MTWLIGKDRRCLWCAETFSALQFYGTGWRLIGPDDCKGTADIDTESALAMLDAMGFTWDGREIARKGAAIATPGALVLEPLDLSKRAQEGCYIVWDSRHEWWQNKEMAGGESWQAFGNNFVTYAYGPLPERPQ